MPLNRGKIGDYLLHKTKHVSVIFLNTDVELIIQKSMQNSTLLRVNIDENSGVICSIELL